MTLCGMGTRTLALVAFGFAAGSFANASTTTQTGSFAADNSVFSLPFTTSMTTSYTAYTTSYAAGGFVPSLTLFSSTGPVITFDSADGVCHNGATPSSSTGICDDAYISATLAPGSYVLDLTEFPNVAAGSLSSGFVFASDPTATGDFCGVSGGMFLEADVAPCVQRTNNFSLTEVSNASTVPEPSTFLLGLPVAAMFFASARRRLL